jgi:PAS domain-containing protein
MRFSDSDYTSPGQLDFVPRERRNHIWRIIIAFAITIALIFILSFAPNSVGGRTMAGLISMGVIMVLCFYVVFRKQQNLDLVMNTEYENMLFAQAAALGSSFCLFVRRDGTITYADDGLRKLFPHVIYSESQALEGIFEQGGVRKTDRERIMASIYSGTSDRLVFPLKQRDGSTQDYILTLDALPRPAGYMVIRGREYLDARTGTQVLPDMLRSTSAERIDHLLNTTPVAHYITDGFGRLEYVTPALEKMLGYTGGEMLHSRMAVQHILFQINGHPIGDDYTIAEAHGTATLQKKQGALLEVVMQQALLRDSTGKIIGASGTFIL